MPVSISSLESGLQTLFSNPPVSDNPSTARANAAQQWADSVQNYALSVVPVSTTVTAAAATLNVTLTSIFASADLLSILPAMETAFLTFATAIGTGMAPAFIATPPPGQIGFASISNQASAAAASQVWASSIDTWFRTGTAVPSGGGSTINWS